MDQPSFTPPPVSPLSTTPAQKSSAGPIIGTVIVIILLALGALYFWGAQLNQQQEQLPYIPGDEAMMGDTASQENWAPPSSNSDEASAIEAELQATDMSAFEQQMNADLNASESNL